MRVNRLLRIRCSAICRGDWCDSQRLVFTCYWTACSLTELLTCIVQLPATNNSMRGMGDCLRRVEVQCHLSWCVANSNRKFVTSRAERTNQNNFHQCYYIQRYSIDVLQKIFCCLAAIVIIRRILLLISQS